MSIRKSITLTAVAAAALFISGCAANQVAQVKRPASDCRNGFIQYCDTKNDLAAPMERCRCVPRRAVTGMLRDLQRR